MACLMRSDSVKMSKPATRPAPLVGAMMPQSMRMVVDLPAPFGPKKPKISPVRTEKEILVHGVNRPKRFTRFCTRDGLRSEMSR